MKGIAFVVMVLITLSGTAAGLRRQVASKEASTIRSLTEKATDLDARRRTCEADLLKAEYGERAANASSTWVSTTGSNYAPSTRTVYTAKASGRPPFQIVAYTDNGTGVTTSYHVSLPDLKDFLSAQGVAR